MLGRIINKIGYCLHRNTSRNITVMAESKKQKMSTSECQKPKGAMAWIDLELTGLDISTCHILEVACLISDEDLNIVGEGLHIVVHQPDSILNNMGSWCTKMHGKTGLTKASRESKVTIKDAEQMLLAQLKKYTVLDKCLMAGSTVYMDRIFINKFMPSVNNYLHYRLIDVSTIKELTRMWKPEVHSSAPEKTLQHKAMTDIQESINELKHYRKYLFT